MRLLPVLILVLVIFHGSAGDLPECPNCVKWDFHIASEPKLLLCWIPKVGCTRFAKLFEPIRDKNFPTLKGERWDDMYVRILRDPTWQKVVFYREPLTRFLSAYLDKCGKRTGHCLRAFGGIPTFDEAVMQLRTRWRGAPGRIDTHFRPQIYFCNGLGFGLAQYYSQELLETATAREKVGSMLRHRNVTVQDFDQLYPPVGVAYTVEKHDVGAEKKVEDAFVDSNHVSTVVDFFYEDYVTFNIPLPAFAKRALLALAENRSKYAFEPSRLATLLAIDGHLPLAHLRGGG